MPQPAPMQDEDVFADFRNQFRAAKDPAAKKALMQQLEDAMYEQMRTHLQPEYDEMDAMDQPPAAPAKTQPSAPKPAPQSFRPVIDEADGPWIPQPRDNPDDEKAGADIYAFQDQNGYEDFVRKNGNVSDTQEVDGKYWSQPGMRQKFEQFRKNNTDDRGEFRPVIVEPPGHAQNDMEPDGDSDDGGQDWSVDDQTAENDDAREFEDQNGYEEFRNKLVNEDDYDESYVGDAFWEQPGMDEKFQRFRKNNSIGGVPLRNVGDMGPPDDEEAFSDPNRGRLQYDKNGGVMRAGEGSVEEDDPDQPPYTSALPAGSMRGAPYPVEGSEESGVGDQYYSQLYRWEKDNGAFDLEFGTPEYKKFIQDYEAKRQRGNGRQMTPGDDAMPPGGKTGMFGRY